jgi:Lrp/AsnC family leucine-responsive transcriptional regulator
MHVGWSGAGGKRFALVVREAAYCRERVVCLTGEEAIPKMVDHRERLLDPIGWRLIAASRQDARLTYSELGARVGLSAPAVAERMRRLEEAGIITGYHAQVAPTTLGPPITAFIRCNSPGLRIGTIAREAPEALECHRVTGDDAFILKVVVASIAHLEGLIDRLLPYRQPTISVVLSSPVPGREVTRASLPEPG